MTQAAELISWHDVYSFYGLAEQPFNITSDPHFFYRSTHHEEALFNIRYGIETRKGFIEITGEIGTGKTTLCHMVLNRLDPDSCKSAIILNPSLSASGMLQAIIEDFGMEAHKKTKISMFKQLNSFLIEETSAGRNAVLIVDEAQNLKPGTLEELRLISNLETKKEKLIQIIFVGQPELKNLLNAHSLRQLRQRINIRYHILPLGSREIKPYIDTRLKAAGLDRPDPGGVDKAGAVFTDDAVEEIYKYSTGIPRLINVVCDRALLSGFVSESQNITGDMIIKSINDIEGLHK